MQLVFNMILLMQNIKTANRKQFDIALKNKALNIAVDPKVNGYQRGLAAMVYKFFNERTKGSGINNKGNLLVN